MSTIAEIGTPGAGLIELRTGACGYLCLLQDGSLILLKPETLLELADTLKDYLDDEAGKGEDPPCEIAQKADGGFDSRDGL